MPDNRPWQFTTLPAFLAEAAVRYGDAPAVEDHGRVLSYRELHAAARGCARALIAAGVGPGERVMLWAPNSAEWIIAGFGIACAGAVMIPVSTRFKGAEVEDLALRGRARLMIAVGEFLGVRHPDLLTPATRAQLGCLVVLGQAGAGEIGWEAFLAAGAATSETAVDARIAALTPQTVCDILFTSGTTGRSKGVLYAHGQFLQVVHDWTGRVGLIRGDRTLVIPPFFHAFGWRGGVVGSLIVGATILPHRAYDAGEVLARVAADRVSVIPGPPAIFQGMLNHPQMAAFDRTSLRLGITGGAVIPAVLVRRMKDDLGFAGVCNGYGLTECGGYGAMCRHDDAIETIANTAGPPMPGIELEAMAPDGRILPQGQTGEIVIRGYIVMQGYLDDPDATARTIDAGGWLHTGDVGRIDAAGNLVIEDRLKDMYICGGFNCYPAEIERMLSDHPAIGQVAVVGVPDDRLGEVGRAFVVLRPGTAATGAEIIGWARRQMANYKVPRAVEIRAGLPVSAQGKVLKRLLRAEALGQGADGG
ncbi:MAG: AMP-binding protein [Rhodobacteraceae bacterium]|jgi:acyl-CoA synthetase (AMP-forming)/AMP-acid ligase II|nr:AMP-binding protein [Paracoccaceae bacterium]